MTIDSRLLGKLPGIVSVGRVATCGDITRLISMWPSAQSIGAGLTAERAYRNQRMALAAAPLTFPTVSIDSGPGPATARERPRPLMRTVRQPGPARHPRAVPPCNWRPARIPHDPIRVQTGDQSQYDRVGAHGVGVDEGYGRGVVCDGHRIAWQSIRLRNELLRAIGMEAAS